MDRLLPLLLATVLALSLPPLTHGLPSSWWSWLWGDTREAPTSTLGPLRADVGPGCVNGVMEYPGIPTEVALQCPTTDPPEPVIVTNEYDCSSYFLCNEGVASLVCCPPGLLYDPPMLTCDDPPHVNCGSRPILPPKETTPTEPPTETTTVTTTEATTVITTETTTAGDTTITTTEVPDTTTISTTEVPDTTTTVTTEADTTTITTVETAPTTTTTPPPPPIDSKCDDLPGYFGNLPVDGDCYSYYECDGTASDEGIIYHCDVGEYGQMVYNPTTQQCDDQWHYPCEDHQIHTV